MKKDTTKNTEELIADNFKKLLLRMPIEKMTVKELAEETGIIRPTFYNHFKDKYEVLEFIIRTELLEPIKPLLFNNMIPAAYMLLLSNMQNDLEFYKRAMNIEGQNSFMDIATGEVTKLLMETLEHLHPKHNFRYSWLSREMLAEYYAHSMCYVAVNWMKRDFAVSPEELTEIYSYITKHSIIDIFNDIV